MNLLELICSCFHPHSLQLILVRYTGVIPNLLKRAHITRGWLTVYFTDAMTQKRPRQTNCIPYYIKQVQPQRCLSVNYTFMVLKTPAISRRSKSLTFGGHLNALWFFNRFYQTLNYLRFSGFTQKCHAGAFGIGSPLMQAAITLLCVKAQQHVSAHTSASTTFFIVFLL